MPFNIGSCLDQAGGGVGKVDDAALRGLPPCPLAAEPTLNCSLPLFIGYILYVYTCTVLGLIIRIYETRSRTKHKTIGS